MRRPRYFFVISCQLYVLALMVGSGCKSFDGSQNKSIHSFDSQDLSNNFGLPEDSDVRVLSELSLPKIDCNEGVYQISLPFDLSGTRTKLIIEADKSKAALKISMFNASQVEVFGSHSSRISEFLCQEASQNESIQKSEEFQNYVKVLLTEVLDGCSQIQILNGIWSCILEQMTSKDALINIKKLQRTMTRKWSRQPYVLARRAALISTMSKLATEENSDHHSLSRFCELMRVSLPEELPLIARSALWRTAVCSASSTDVNSLLLYGVNLSVDELIRLADFYESNSIVGRVSMNLSNSDLPLNIQSQRQPFRVTIIPVEDLATGISQGLRKSSEVREHDRGELKSRKSVNDKDLQHPTHEITADATSSNGCFNPFFSKDPRLSFFAVSSSLHSRFVGEFRCRSLVSPKLYVDSFYQYLLASFSSDTEFIVDNGQSKTIRLPVGRYSLKIEALPQNPLEEYGSDSDEQPSITRAIEWSRSSRVHEVHQWSSVNPTN